LHFAQIRGIKRTLETHHSRDWDFINKIQEAMAANGKEPWRCKWCMRLNKMAALRCGKCDTLWHRCIDHTCVHGGRQDYAEEWTYYRQPSRARSASHHSSASEGQPRGKNPKGKKTRQKKNKNLAPDLDPPWTSKNNAPLPALPDQPTASTSASEAYVQELVAALQDDELCAVLQGAQKLVSEGPKPPTTSKDMHAAVEKLDQARNRFQAAQKARKNLQTIPGRHTLTRASKDGNRSLPTSARKTRIWKKG
jgi:hypothetical protein